eukprot:1111275_1
MAPCSISLASVCLLGASSGQFVSYIVTVLPILISISFCFDSSLRCIGLVAAAVVAICCLIPLIIMLRAPNALIPISFKSSTVIGLEYHPLFCIGWLRILRRIVRIQDV